MKQQQLAVGLIQCLVIGSIAALTLKGFYLSDKMPAGDLDTSSPKRAKDLTAPSRFEPVLAAILAYGYYVAAALLANAKFPQYLREHLFDGLAPAALVGFLVSLFPSYSDAPKAFPRIRRPITVAFLFGLGGSLVFALIAAAAVFSTGINDFRSPVAFCAASGGAIFLVNYLNLVQRPDRSWRTPRSQVKWLLSKRPEDATESDLGSPADPSAKKLDVGPEGTALPQTDNEPEKSANAAPAPALASYEDPVSPARGSLTCVAGEISYLCRCCGERHDGLPMSCGTDAPEYWDPSLANDESSMLEQEWCIIRAEHFFVRGRLVIPVIDALPGAEFEWGVWVSLSPDNFARVLSLWTNAGRGQEPPYLGWLSTELPLYQQSTLLLKTRVHMQAVGNRPLVELEPTDHPLAADQHTGITLARVQEIAETLLHRLPASGSRL